MSFNDKICNLDIINIIFKLSDSVDTKTALPCVSKSLYTMLKRKAYFALNQDNLRLELSFNNLKLLNLKLLNVNKIIKINCINKECNDICGCLGFTSFIYSDNEDKILNNDNYIIVYSRNETVINRYIPYCKECTYKFVNFGDRNKPIIFGSYYFMHNNNPLDLTYSYL